LEFRVHYGAVLVGELQAETHEVLMSARPKEGAGVTWTDANIVLIII